MSRNGHLRPLMARPLIAAYGHRRRRRRWRTRQRLVRRLSAVAVAAITRNRRAVLGRRRALGNIVGNYGIIEMHSPNGRRVFAGNRGTSPVAAKM